jgi:putative solute:sodium symporter small subunit
MPEQWPGNTPDMVQPENNPALSRYWRSNLLTMFVLLGIWAAAGLGGGILVADWLNKYHLPGTGYPLGFWFAQQGSIMMFVILILVYCVLMNRLDSKHHEEIQSSN